MNTKLQWKTNMTLFALAAAATLTAGTAIGDDSQVLNSGDVESMSKWYGRAGGLVESDRVSAARASGAKVGITYDKDVAERTNMTREPADGKSIGISYDKDVAERTHMTREPEDGKSIAITYDKDVADRTNLPRGQTAPDAVKAAEGPGPKPQ